MARYSRSNRRRAAGKGGAVRGYTLRDRKGRIRYIGVSNDPSRSRPRTGDRVRGYSLRDSKGRPTYYGVSNNPRQRAAGKGGAVQGYSLRDSKGRPTYYGVTSDPSRRAAEHKRDGKRGKLQVETRPMPRGFARHWEKRKLARHRKTHRGRNPVHNKTRSGDWRS